MTGPADPVTLIALAGGAPLPWRVNPDEPGEVLDAENGTVCQVDADRQRSDVDVNRLALAICEAVNAAGRAEAEARGLIHPREAEQ